MECIGSTKQPSPMENSSRITLHYVIQNNSACELVLHLPKLRTADSAPMDTFTCDQPVSLTLQMVLGWRPHVLERQHVLCVSVKELLLL